MLQDLSEVYMKFPHVPRGNFDRPAGDVAIMLGLDMTELQSTGGDYPKDTVSNMRVLHTKLGSGYVLESSCEGIPHLTHNAYNITTSATGVVQN